MNKIAEQFAERFAYWDITLASDSLKKQAGLPSTVLVKMIKVII